MKKLNNNGFTALEVILLVTIVAIVGAGSYYVYTQQDSSGTNSSQTSTEATPNNQENTSTKNDSVAIGEEATNNESSITLTDYSVEDAKYVTGSEVKTGVDQKEVKDDRKFLVVDFKITNNSDSTKDYSQSIFKLQKSDKTVVQSQLLTSDENKWNPPELASGGETEGKVAFEIKEGEEKNAMVLWESPDWLVESDTIKINL